MDWHTFYNGILKAWDYPARLWQGPLRIFDWLMEYVSKGLAVLVALIVGLFPQLDPLIASQVAGSVGYAPWAILSIPLRRQQSPEAEATMAKAGGFMRGICHAYGDYEQLLENNISWERLDCPFPFEADGVTLTEGYKNYKQNLIERRDAGMKTMVVTPNPGAFVDRGMDPRTPEGLAKTTEVAVFMVQDLKPYISAVQIGNELGLPRFMRPLNIEESAQFIIAQIKALQPVKGDVLVGYNTAGPQMDLNSLVKPYGEYLDFFGLDIYLGCFFGFPSYMWVFDLAITAMWSYMQKPIVMAEFGYMSAGEPKTTEQKNALLMERYGYPNEAAVRADPEGFLVAVGNYSKQFGDYIGTHAGEDLNAYMFGVDCAVHLYCELPSDFVIPGGYPHSPEGQAKFYKEVIPRFARYPYVIGEFIYAWKDAEACYACGQTDCPQETGWGLLNADGSAKPSLAVVKEQYGKLK
ncbi:MAG: hypothetical protein FWC27_13190 [Firmicutes bacterium]|nr:hypothetical protein [Bacillota bacterium]